MPYCFPPGSAQALQSGCSRDDASIQFHGGFRGRRGTEGYNGGASLQRHPGGSPWLNKDSTGWWLMVVNGG